MNMEIVQGNFCAAKKYCDRKMKDSICFELSYMDSDEEARIEFNRFRQQIYSDDIISVSFAAKSVILNLSDWNESCCFNRYLESFLYMLSDMQDKVNCRIILEKEINKDLFKKMQSLNLFDLSLTALPDMEKKKESVKLGFYDASAEKGEQCNV